MHHWLGKLRDEIGHCLSIFLKVSFVVPVDVLCLPDGSLLISDDYADAIYRVTWVGHKSP